MSVNTSVARVIREGNRYRIIYRDHGGEITERVIDVERIWQAGNGATCVMAHCHLRGERRTFDMARIIDAMPETTTARPHTFGDEERVAARWLPVLSNPYVICAEA